MASQAIEWRWCEFPSGAVYKGGMRDYRKEGRGYWTHPDGESYEGGYKDNLQHEWGSYQFQGGNREYRGEWKEGRMEGIGLYTLDKEKREMFVGTWVGDRKDGEGIFWYGDGRVNMQKWEQGNLIEERDATPVEQYSAFMQTLLIDRHCEAFFRNLPLDMSGLPAVDASAGKLFDKQIASRTYTYPSGATHDGEFLGNKRHGVGLWIHPSGDKYEGEFHYNKQQGWGQYTTRTGKHYKGGWKDGMMDGWGVYYFSDALDEHFVGPYVADQKHGVGVYTFASGQKRMQRWDKGKLVVEKEIEDTGMAEHYEEVRRLITSEKLKPTAETTALLG